MTPYNHAILIADNHFLVSEAMVHILRDWDEYELIGVVKSVYELNNSLALNTHANLLITDYYRVDYKGIDDLKTLLTAYPNLRVLILTNQMKPMDVAEFSKVGIKNIIYKTANSDEIIQAIQFTLQGKIYYSDEVLDLLVHNSTQRDEVKTPLGLTPAETEITKLIANGMTTKAIAANKSISFHTVMSHRKNIFRKINVKNTSELTRYAIRTGLIDNIEYYI